MTPLTDEQRAILALVRSRLAWIDSLEEPEKSLAIAAVPESQWPERIRWIKEAAGLIRGTTEKAPR